MDRSVSNSNRIKDGDNQSVDVLRTLEALKSKLSQGFHI